MVSPKILYLGATGYAGGCALTKLFLDRKSDEEVTVLVRSAEKAEKFKKYGVLPVVGSLEDAQLVEKLASESDIVINIADSWDVNWANNILCGLRKRYETTGIKPVFIHTSGTGVLVDDARGRVLSNIIYDDTDIERMASISPDAPHRGVDLAIINADEEGCCLSYIIIPSIIWGEPRTELVKDGIQNAHSIPIPLAASVMLDIGQSAVTGDGIPRLNHVEVNELADLYVALYDAVRVDSDGTRIGHGKNGYYFAENGECSWMQIGVAMGRALQSLDPSKPATVRSYTPEEESRYPLAHHWGTNQRCIGNHSRSLGWDPKLTTENFLDTVPSDIERWVKDGKPLAYAVAQMDNLDKK
ncbi:hypothetical protein VKT23_009259 [Stygiomarasmius scandens]|uniref:NAD(P)-binding domain-containing protein n=1 Tax=Marasmiellus scandens TaxID=2682957 RepID=A0ABR1JHL2_9AGAR